MTNGSAAECVARYDVPDAEMASQNGESIILRWKTIPWKRVIVDTLLVAGILLASSSFLSVR